MTIFFNKKVRNYKIQVKTQVTEHKINSISKTDMLNSKYHMLNIIGLQQKVYKDKNCCCYSYVKFRYDLCMLIMKNNINYRKTKTILLLLITYYSFKTKHTKTKLTCMYSMPCTKD